MPFQKVTNTGDRPIVLVNSAYGADASTKMLGPNETWKGHVTTIVLPAIGRVSFSVEEQCGAG